MTGEHHNVDKPVPGGADLLKFRGRPAWAGRAGAEIVISPEPRRL
jgi:hypothetical protein